jgi:hypothetical protein
MGNMTDFSNSIPNPRNIPNLSTVPVLYVRPQNRRFSQSPEQILCRRGKSQILPVGTVLDFFVAS